MLQTNFPGLLVGPALQSFQVASCIDESMVGIVFLQCLCACLTSAQSVPKELKG
jgi:hypothetical protein